MSSSDSSPEAPDGSVSDPSFDFASAAQTLTELQHELKEIKEANGTIEEAEELASRMETMTEHVSAAGEDLQSTAKDLATACRHLTDHSEVNSDMVEGLEADIQDLDQKLDLLRRELPSESQTNRSLGESDPPSSPVQVRWDTAGVFVLLLFVIGLQLGLGQGFLDRSSDLSPASPELDSTARAVEVQVLNGVGKSGLAARFKAVLEKEGISVVDIGNAPIGTFAETTVFVHRNASVAAKQIARLLGIPTERVRVGPTSPSGLDITIIVGADFDSMTPFDGKELSAPSAQER